MNFTGYQHCARQGFPALEDWLRTPDAAEMIDDAVLGRLTADTVDELLEDYGVRATHGTRRLFLYFLDTAIAEGF
jgi:hypothetical protein